jgi:hypothetical protein
MDNKNPLHASQAEVSIGVPTSITHEEVEKKIQHLRDQVEAMVRSAHEKIDFQIQKTQDSFLTIFGIFGSVLSLLTIEFQFFKEKLPVMQVAGLTLVLFSLLLSFVLALDYIIASRFQKHNCARILLSLLVIVALGLGFACLYLYR